jgi:hypothetical protein
MSLFRKKQRLQAFAVTLEDGRAIADRGISKLHQGYQNEPMFDILVRVEPSNEPPFEAKMKAGMSKTFLLVPGVRVQVQYDATDNKHVTIDDDLQAILARNPQLIRKE